MNFFAPAFLSYERARPEFGLAESTNCFTLGLARVETVSWNPTRKVTN